LMLTETAYIQRG